MPTLVHHFNLKLITASALETVTLFPAYTISSHLVQELILMKINQNKEITQVPLAIINNYNKTVIKHAKSITLDVKPTSTSTVIVSRKH